MNRKFTLQSNSHQVLQQLSSGHAGKQQQSQLSLFSLPLSPLTSASNLQKKKSPLKWANVCVCVRTCSWNSWRWGQRHCSLLLTGQDAAELVFRLWPAQTGLPQASCSQELYSMSTHTHTYTWQGHSEVIANPDYKHREGGWEHWR